ncbi:hypothetical protein [Sinorhizobium medicae]
MTVHYPHHPLFGKRVRRQGVDHREGGAVAHVETAPGNVIVIPTWMLDPIAYAGMEIGKPRASLEALIMAFELGDDAWDEPAPERSRTDGIGHVVDGGGLCSGEGGAA